MEKIIHSKFESFVRIIFIWQIIFTFLSMAGLVLIIFLGFPTGFLWAKILLMIIFLCLAIANFVAFFKMQKRESVGRVIAIITNFITFILLTISALQLLKFFLAFDGFADNFEKGFFPLVILGLLIVLKGKIISHMNETKTIKITKIGFNIIIIAVLLYFLFVVNIFPWLFSILINITNPIALAVTLLAILFGIMLFVLTRQVVAEEFNGTIEQSEAIAGFIFLSPNLLGFLLFFAGPLIFSLYVSLTDWDALGTKNFIGIENYQSIFSLTIKGLKEKTQAASDVIDITKYDELGRINLFGKYFLIGAKDKLFWIALRNTLLFGLMTVPLTVSLSLLLATILNSEVPGVKIFRVLYFIPSIAAVVGIAIIWSWLLHGSIGFVNWAITNIVNFLNVIPFVNIVDPKINWLSDSATALFSIVIMSVWQTMGFNTVLFLTGLQGISGSLYEAATIDGANNVDKFWRITIPMLAPTTFFVISTSTIQALQLFEQVFIATGFDPGGPNNATLSIVLYLYKKGFRWFQSGYASATAWVLFFLIFLITVFQYRYQKRLEENF